MNSTAQIMGIVNATPDSFSDGGIYTHPEKVLSRAKELIENGADIIDLGAESTAPGNNAISAKEEWQRLQEIIPLLATNNIPFSLDSYKAETWKRAAEIQPDIIFNDVSGLKKEKYEKIEILKKYPHTKCIIMFSRDISLPDPEDIMQEIEDFFMEILEILESEGIQKKRIILDPGMGGFLSKTPEVSFTVLKKLSQLKKFGCMILVGTSRKSFLREVSHTTDPSKRTIASVVSSLCAIKNGADIVRVHDVQEMKEALQTMHAIR